jgi:hypothetical protein
MTWNELLDALLMVRKDHPEKLDREVAIAPNEPDHDKPVELCPAVCFGTVADLFHVEGEPAQLTRSVEDGTHRPDRLVLSIDGHPFDRFGNWMSELDPDTMLWRGDADGIWRDDSERPYSDECVAAARQYASLAAGSPEAVAFRAQQEAKHGQKFAYLANSMDELRRMGMEK